MKIEKFWVVTRPGPESSLADILFEADVKRIAFQFRGGLNEDDIFAIFTTQNEASKEARRLMEAPR